MVTVPRIVRLPGQDSSGEPIVLELELRGEGDEAPLVLVIAGTQTTALDLGDLVEAVQVLEALAARTTAEQYRAGSRI